MNWEKIDKKLEEGTLTYDELCCLCCGCKLSDDLIEDTLDENIKNSSYDKLNNYNDCFVCLDCSDNIDPYFKRLQKEKGIFSIYIRKFIPINENDIKNKGIYVDLSEQYNYRDLYYGAVNIKGTKKWREKIKKLLMLK